MYNRKELLYSEQRKHWCKCRRTGGSNNWSNVYIGPGAVIFGDIYIADNCYIGANAVVTKSINEPYSVVVGAPAKIIKTENKNWLEKQNNIR